MLKNWKMSTKISTVVGCALIIGLLVLCFVVQSSASSSMKEVTLNRMQEASDARAELLKQYIANQNTYVTGATYTTIVKTAITNQKSSAVISQLQDYVDHYAAMHTNLEGLFVCDLDTYVIAHSNHDAIGSYASTREAMEPVYDVMFQNGQAFLRGIKLSPTTGTQVVVSYAPVFNDYGEGIGYVGVGVNAEGLINILDSLEFKGLENSSFLLLDTASSTVIYSTDTAQIGQEVTDPEILELIQKGTSSTSGTYSFVNSAQGLKCISAYTSIPEYNMLFAVLDTEEEAFASVKKLSSFVVLLSLVVLVVVLLITVGVVASISKDLAKVTGIITDIGASMDMTRSSGLAVYEGRKDEIGKIVGATRRLTDSVTDVVKDLQEKSKELYTTSESLTDIASQTLNNVSQVDIAVQEIAEGATSQAQETEKASNNVTEMGNQISETVAEASAMQAVSAEIHSSSEDALQVIHSLSDIGSKARAAVDEIYEQTNVTNASAQRIKEATDIISSIAEETNLLSLNASIEAARAGEAGRGFAVVATQIQKLAEQSNESAQLIESITSTLISDSDKAVETMEEVKTIMVNQGEYVEKVIDIFGEVKSGIDNTISGIGRISEKATVMDQSRNAVVDTVQNLSSIAEENAASAEETSASATLVGNLMHDISDSAARLSGIAKEVDESISTFTI
ncbi:MAG: methyl-accepting chemotaxis protein [Lachnospiraceae bacterium]|nr:methyl-accepting chemotaxis protein [Lachnospiraceae bacterium]